VRIAGLLCKYVGIWYHDPVIAQPTGWRCGRCGTPGLTQGELLGVDDHLDFWRLTASSRRQLETDAESRSEPAAIVRPVVTRSVVRSLTRAV
jgi:hypothetical protein